ncbi:MAG: P-loop containing nucleoside triphosphate hydrolase protein, partial [Olpidium bornovanus]
LYRESLICSDLISRGIDLELVNTVISYDVPLHIKKYIHRVGRTARAGREGTAYTLIEEQEARHFKEMMRAASHMDALKRVGIRASELEPLHEDYKEALSKLRADLGAQADLLER